MRKRYVARPRAYIEHTEDGSSFMPSLEVDDAKWTDTGLIMPDGTPIWREPNPIGFIWPEEET